jgi:hypothetical protein
MRLSYVLPAVVALLLTGCCCDCDDPEPEQLDAGKPCGATCPTSLPADVDKSTCAVDVCNQQTNACEPVYFEGARCANNTGFCNYKGDCIPQP